jgi:hypothetical protein
MLEIFIDTTFPALVESRLDRVRIDADTILPSPAEVAPSSIADMSEPVWILVKTRILWVAQQSHEDWLRHGDVGPPRS